MQTEFDRTNSQKYLNNSPSSPASSSSPMQAVGVGGQALDFSPQAVANQNKVWGQAMKGGLGQTIRQQQAYNQALVNQPTPEEALTNKYNNAVRMAGNLRNLGQMIQGRQALKNGLGGAYESMKTNQMKSNVGLRERLSQMDQNKSMLDQGLGTDNLPGMFSSVGSLSSPSSSYTGAYSNSNYQPFDWQE